MAIDQRDITSKLRMMDDRALQQYAAMHKSDPYVFPLAFQESQNRQKIRMSGQAQMAGQEMPKVNDAALMAMAPQAAPPQAPQAQGISNLPAPNMQGMADGGIAGYDEDGGMSDFAQRSEPVVRMSDGGVPRYQGMPIDIGGNGSLVDEYAGIDDQIVANMERQRLEGAFDEYSKYIPTPKKGSKAAKKLEEEAKKEAKKEEPAKKPELPALTPYVPKTALQTRAETETMAAPDLAEIQASYKPFAEQFAQDRTRIEGREKNNLSDSLIRAGLATMAGKSQFAMQNIGEGGIQGLNAYQEAQKANEASRRALTQSEMLMTQAQRAERMGARGEAAKFVTQAEVAQQAATQFGQKAREIENTKAYQDESIIIARQNAATQGRMADSSMVSALAQQSRANALGGTSGDKHMAALVKVQNALNADKEYQQAAKDARFQGKVGDNARATMERKKREVYRLLAPELLQSLDAGNKAPPAGSGGGTKLPPLSSFNM